MSHDRTAYIAHCVDTEGSLHTSLAVTVERLQQIFGLDGLDQVPGDCRRSIGRCLTVGPRSGLLTESEVRFVYSEIRAKPGDYYHGNLDFEGPFRRWSYVFDGMSFEWSTVDRVVVATNDRRGYPHIVTVV